MQELIIAVSAFVLGILVEWVFLRAKKEPLKTEHAVGLAALVIAILTLMGAMIQQINQRAPVASPSFTGCNSAVYASRPLTTMGTGDDCWLILEDGSATELGLTGSGQVTFRMGGNDSFFSVITGQGRLPNITGATIRPDAFVRKQFNGNYDEVKIYEQNYHSGQFGGTASCLRDWNNGSSPLTSSCPK